MVSLEPYPLLAAACSAGTVHIWGTSGGKYAGEELFRFLSSTRKGIPVVVVALQVGAFVVLFSFVWHVALPANQVHTLVLVPVCMFVTSVLSVHLHQCLIDFRFTLKVILFTVCLFCSHTSIYVCMYVLLHFDLLCFVVSVERRIPIPFHRQRGRRHVCPGLPRVDRVA